MSFHQFKPRLLVPSSRMRLRLHFREGFDSIFHYRRCYNQISHSIVVCSPDAVVPGDWICEVHSPRGNTLIASGTMVAVYSIHIRRRFVLLPIPSMERHRLPSVRQASARLRWLASQLLIRACCAKPSRDWFPVLAIHTTIPMCGHARPLSLFRERVEL